MGNCVLFFEKDNKIHFITFGRYMDLLSLLREKGIKTGQGWSIEDYASSKILWR